MDRLSRQTCVIYVTSEEVRNSLSPLRPDLVPFAFVLIHLGPIWIAFRYFLAYFDALPISNIQYQLSSIHYRLIALSFTMGDQGVNFQRGTTGGIEDGLHATHLLTPIGSVDKQKVYAALRLFATLLRQVIAEVKLQFG